MAIPIIFAFIFPETAFAFLLLVGNQRIMISTRGTGPNLHSSQFVSGYTILI